ANPCCSRTAARKGRSKPAARRRHWPKAVASPAVRSNTCRSPVTTMVRRCWGRWLRSYRRHSGERCDVRGFGHADGTGGRASPVLGLAAAEAGPAPHARGRLDRSRRPDPGPGPAVAVGRPRDGDIHRDDADDSGLDDRTSRRGLAAPAEGARTMSQPLTASNWFGKASAGFILGLAIAIGISGLLTWAMDLGDTLFSLEGQFTMWMVSPIWCGILSFCFLFR